MSVPSQSPPESPPQDPPQNPFAALDAEPSGLPVAAKGSPNGAAPADRLLDAGEVAELLAVPERWVRERTRSGDLPSISLGRDRRYRRESVLAWLADKEEGGATRRYRPRSRNPA